MEYFSFNKYLKDKFGQKVYKISLDGGFTCPNRDGKTGTRGCIFCSKGGSGDFAESREMSITEQIESGKKKIEKKIKSGKYIAYFQAFTNTYGSIDKLRQLYFEAANLPDVVGISIATRPVAVRIVVPAIKQAIFCDAAPLKDESILTPIWKPL